MAFSSRCVYLDKSVPFGKYWRNSPYLFSLVPRFQGLHGSAKTIWISNRWANCACLTIGAMLGIWPRRSVPAPEVGMPYEPASAPPTVRCQGSAW